MATTQVVRSERFPDLADEVLFPRLSDAKLEWLAKRGTRRRFEPGEVLYEHAERDAPFYVIERGLVEFIDRKPGKMCMLRRRIAERISATSRHLRESQRSARAWRWSPPM